LVGLEVAEADGAAGRGEALRVLAGCQRGWSRSGKEGEKRVQALREQIFLVMEVSRKFWRNFKGFYSFYGFINYLFSNCIKFFIMLVIF
jgi:hypothetical protein